MDSIRARRSKHVSEKLKTATEGDKKELAKARLDALENDDALPLDTQTADSDEDFQLEDSDDDAGSRPCHFRIFRSFGPFLTEFLTAQ